MVLFGIILAAGGAGCADRIDGLIDCETDEDCPNGYCDLMSHFCFSGQRECDRDTDCNPPQEICVSGQCRPGCGSAGCDIGESCNPVTGRCRFLQSCTIDSNCQPPATVCIADYCEPGCGITGCQTGYCDPYSGHCQGGGGCEHDGDCAPPSTVCDGADCVSGCLTTGCTGTDECNASTGRCDPVGGCTGDGDCSPPSTVCEGSACVPGCLSTGCTGTDVCSTSTGRCGPSTGCTGDGDCAPPTTICESTQCVPGCGTAGCTGTDECNTTTGRCEPAGGLLADGADCTQSSQCQSGQCRYFEINHSGSWLPFNVCTRACCTENDCGANHACMYHDGTKLCIPDRIFPTGYAFTLSAGQTCSPGSPIVCRSGYCNPDNNTCVRTCCESSDCATDLCSWFPDTSNIFELCRAQGSIGFGTTGASCSSEYDCQSFVCLVPQYVCANMCCSNADCPGGYRCAQILGGPQGIEATTVCVPGTPGATPDGGTCTPGDAPAPACQSGLCAGGTCRSPCCHDTDCASGACRAVQSGVDLDNDGQSDWVRACVP